MPGALRRPATKTLLTVTAVFEGATGLALLASPALVATLLLGAPIDTPAALAVARVAGAAVLALALACWLARAESHAPASSPVRAARVMVAAMLLYNVAAVAILAYARLGSGLTGIGLWPAIVLHTGLAAWCIAGLRDRDAARPDNEKVS